MGATLMSVFQERSVCPSQRRSASECLLVSKSSPIPTAPATHVTRGREGQTNRRISAAPNHHTHKPLPLSDPLDRHIRSVLKIRYM